MTPGWQTQGRAPRAPRDRKRRRSKPQRQPSDVRQQPAQERVETQPRSAASSTSTRWQSPRSPIAQAIRPEDYSYVYSDLKRIAVLAASIFVVLIALSFIIK